MRAGGEEPEDDVDDEEDEEELMKGKDRTSIKVIQNPYRNYKVRRAAPQTRVAVRQTLGVCRRAQIMKRLPGC